ncbi:hypothetical protein HDU98_004511, partial [Podochytrium sp. JEL0797]
AAVSPDGCTLACGSSSGDHSVQLFDLTHGGESRAPVLLKGHELGVSALDWCKRDYEQLASCSDEQVVRIWNVRHARNAVEYESGKPEEDEACLKHLVGRSEKGQARVVVRQSRMLEKLVEIAPVQPPPPAPTATDTLTLTREMHNISPETILATSTPNTPTTSRTHTLNIPSLASSPLPRLTHDRHATLTNEEMLESPHQLQKTGVCASEGGGPSTPSGRRLRAMPGSVHSSPIQTSLNKYFTAKPKKKVVMAPLVIGVAEKDEAGAGGEESAGSDIMVAALDGDKARDVNAGGGDSGGAIEGSSDGENPFEVKLAETLLDVEPDRLEAAIDVQALPELAAAEDVPVETVSSLAPTCSCASDPEEADTHFSSLSTEVADTQLSSLPTEPISESQTSASSSQCFKSPKTKDPNPLYEKRPKQRTFGTPNTTSDAGLSSSSSAMSRVPSHRSVSSLSASIYMDTPPSAGLRSASAPKSAPSTINSNLNNRNGGGVTMTRGGSSNRSALSVCSNNSSNGGNMMTRSASNRSLKNSGATSGECSSNNINSSNSENMSGGGGVSMTRGSSSKFRSVMGSSDHSGNVMMARSTSSNRSMKSLGAASGNLSSNPFNGDNTIGGGVAMTRGGSSKRRSVMGLADSRLNQPLPQLGSMGSVMGVGKRSYSQTSVTSNIDVKPFGAGAGSSSTCAGGGGGGRHVNEFKKRIKIHQKEAEGSSRCEVGKDEEECDIMALVDDALETSFTPKKGAVVQRAVTLDSGLFERRDDVDMYGGGSLDPDVLRYMDDKRVTGSDTEYGTCECGCPMLDLETCRCIRYSSTIATRMGKGKKDSSGNVAYDLVDIGEEQENVCTYHWKQWGLI